MLPNLVERLRGTPVRVSERLVALPANVLTRQDSGAWSIQENIGHLWDLEQLWSNRLTDFLSGQETLTPADLENRKTHTANHNDRDLSALVAGFRIARSELVHNLERLTAADLRCTALHPRLQQPMTITGMCEFVAEHDDHHVAQITQLMRRFGK
jgi:uncharacterized damage-inducible protein DinB